MEWRLSGGQPIWTQLCRQITRRILTGVYPPGSRLPSVRELAAEAGVNPNTMQRALAQLEQSGLAESNRTAGRLVTQDERVIEAERRRAALEIICWYLDAMAELGYDRAQARAMLEEEKK